MHAFSFEILKYVLSKKCFNYAAMVKSHTRTAELKKIENRLEPGRINTYFDRSGSESVPRQYIKFRRKRNWIYLNKIFTNGRSKYIFIRTPLNSYTVNKTKRFIEFPRTCIVDVNVIYICIHNYVFKPLLFFRSQLDYTISLISFKRSATKYKFYKSDQTLHIVYI